jgi:hypothetical protein
MATHIDWRQTMAKKAKTTAKKVKRKLVASGGGDKPKAG